MLCAQWGEAGLTSWCGVPCPSLVCAPDPAVLWDDEQHGEVVEHPYRSQEGVTAHKRHCWCAYRVCISILYWEPCSSWLSYGCLGDAAGYAARAGRETLDGRLGLCCCAWIPAQAPEHGDR